MIISLDIIDESDLSKNSRYIYKQTIKKINKINGLEPETFDSNWYLTNLDKVISDIKSNWSIKYKHDFTTKLNHLTWFFRNSLKADKYVEYRHRFENLINDFTSEEKEVDENLTMSWETLSTRLFDYSQDKTKQLRSRLIALIYSYGYVFRSGELLKLNVFFPESENYLNMETGEGHIRDTKNKKSRTFTFVPELLEELKKIRGEVKHSDKYEPLIFKKNGDFYNDHNSTFKDLPNVHQIRHIYETSKNWTSESTVAEAQENSEFIGHSANTAIKHYVDKKKRTTSDKPRKIIRFKVKSNK